MPEVWVAKVSGAEGEERFLIKVSDGQGTRAYTATGVVLDYEPVGRVRELYVSAEEVRVVEEKGEIVVYIDSKSHALAEKLMLVLKETPVRIST